MIRYNKKRKFFSKKERELIFKENGKVCQRCDSLELPLEIHHLDGNRENNQSLNLVILCKKCHSKVHSIRFYFTLNGDGESPLKRYLPLAYARLTISDNSKFSEAQRKFRKGELFMPTEEQVNKLVKELGMT